jgi:hypothetical protein
MTDFKPTHTFRGKPVALTSDGYVRVDYPGGGWELVSGDNLTPIPDKPEPPAEIVVNVDTCGVRRFDSSPHGTDYRYVRADKGDVVIPRQMAQAFMDWWNINEGYVDPSITAIRHAIRAQQGGAR